MAVAQKAMAADLNQMNLTLLNVEDSLEEIANYLKTPTTTAATEFREMGIRALINDWLEEALEEFAHALSLNRYDFIAHYYQGIAQLRRNEIDLARGEFETCIRYALSKTLQPTDYVAQSFGAMAALELYRLSLSDDDERGGRKSLRQTIAVTYPFPLLRSGRIGNGDLLRNGHAVFAPLKQKVTISQLNSAATMLAYLDKDIDGIAMSIAEDMSAWNDAITFGVPEKIVDKACDLVVDRLLTPYWHKVSPTLKGKVAKIDLSSGKGIPGLESAVSTIAAQISDYYRNALPRTIKQPSKALGIIGLFSRNPAPFEIYKVQANQASEQEKKWLDQLNHFPISPEWPFENYGRSMDETS